MGICDTLIGSASVNLNINLWFTRCFWIFVDIASEIPIFFYAGHVKVKMSLWLLMMLHCFLSFSNRSIVFLCTWRSDLCLIVFWSRAREAFLDHDLIMTNLSKCGINSRIVRAFCVHRTSHIIWLYILMEDLHI
jgi:hypothetical protein